MNTPIYLHFFRILKSSIKENIFINLFMRHLIPITLILIFLISVRTSFATQEYSKYQNHTLLYEMCFEGDSIELPLNFLEYYGGCRLLLRVAEMAVIISYNYFIHSLENHVDDEKTNLLLLSTLLDISMNNVYNLYCISNYENKDFIYKFNSFLAYNLELFAYYVLIDYLSLKVFAPPCTLCKSPMEYPIKPLSCDIHWACNKCILEYGFNCPHIGLH